MNLCYAVGFLRAFSLKHAGVITNTACIAFYCAYVCMYVCMYTQVIMYRTELYSPAWIFP
jgi:hypothetical protein